VRLIVLWQLILEIANSVGLALYDKNTCRLPIGPLQTKAESVCVSLLKSGFHDVIASQLQQMGMPNLTILDEGIEIHLGKCCVSNKF